VSLPERWLGKACIGHVGNCVLEIGVSARKLPLISGVVFRIDVGIVHEVFRAGKRY